MDARNRIGLYGSYFLCMSGIGFTLPYLPLYLRQQGMSDQAIGIVSMLAAVAGLVQFPAGVWSDRRGTRKPLLILALAVLAAATLFLREARGTIVLGVLVVLFAENGACRATVESLAGAEAVQLAPPDRLGAALGALRFWRPIGIMAVALAGSVLADYYGPQSILLPLAVLQALAVVAALLIREKPVAASTPAPPPHLPSATNGMPSRHSIWTDARLWVFVAAMILFHAAAAPGGVYLGLFLKQDLAAPDRFLPYVFVVMMATWMLVVRPAGALADRLGRRPLLLLTWSAMAARLGLIALAHSPPEILGIQVLDGLAQALFNVVAAAWVTDRLADHRRAGEAQVLVGSCLVLGSAVGPLLAGLAVESLGYRAMFGLLAGIAFIATLLVLAFVPETLPVRVKVGQAPELLPLTPQLAANSTRTT
jgi:MFS family permease